MQEAIFNNVKVYYKRLLNRVHPDLFSSFPERRQINEDGIKIINPLMAVLSGDAPLTPPFDCFVNFWVWNTERSHSSLVHHKFFIMGKDELVKPSLALSFFHLFSKCQVETCENHQGILHALQSEIITKSGIEGEFFKGEFRKLYDKDSSLQNVNIQRIMLDLSKSSFIKYFQFDDSLEKHSMFLCLQRIWMLREAWEMLFKELPSFPLVRIRNGIESEAFTPDSVTIPYSYLTDESSQDLKQSMCDILSHYQTNTIIR